MHVCRGLNDRDLFLSSFGLGDERERKKCACVCVCFSLNISLSLSLLLTLFFATECTLYLDIV